MNNWHTVEFFVNVVDVSLLFTYVYIMMQGKGLELPKVLVAVIVQASVDLIAAMIVQASINSIVSIYFCKESLIVLMIKLLSTSFIMHLTFKWEYMKTYFYCMRGIALMVFAGMLSTLTILIVEKSAPNIYYYFDEYGSIGAIIPKALYFSVLIFLKKRSIKDIKLDDTLKYQTTFIVSFNIIAGFLAIWLYIYAYDSNGYEGNYMIIMFLGIMLFGYNVSALIKKMADQINKEAEWKAREREFQRQRFYTGSIEEMLKQMKAERHDFNHHIGCLYGLLHADKKEEALEYIDSLTKITEAFNYYINIQEPVVASILNTKSVKAKVEGIEILFNVDLPDKILIEPIDLSIVLGNLLDNAIEACIKLPKALRKISVEMHIKNQYLMIKVSNSKGEEELDMLEEGFITSKTDTENHGFGLNNIKKVIEKLNGIIKVEDLGEDFKVNIAVPL